MTPPDKTIEAVVGEPAAWRFINEPTGEKYPWNDASDPVEFVNGFGKTVPGKPADYGIEYAYAYAHPAPALTAGDSEELARLRALVNSPELHDFARGVVLEAGHQRERWGNEHDAGKEPADWFWLVGYLAGKALNAHKDGNTDKALHHTISTAAALANWHGAIIGTTNMRPGIDGESALVRRLAPGVTG